MRYPYEMIVAQGCIDDGNAHAGVAHLLESIGDGEAQEGMQKMLVRELQRFKLDPYAALNVSSDCEPVELKNNYRKLILLYHPDKNDKTAALFQTIQAAHELLSDAKKRRQFDREHACRTEKGRKLQAQERRKQQTKSNFRAKYGSMAKEIAREIAKAKQRAGKGADPTQKQQGAASGRQHAAAHATDDGQQEANDDRWAKWCTGSSAEQATGMDSTTTAKDEIERRRKVVASLRQAMVDDLEELAGGSARGTRAGVAEGGGGAARGAAGPSERHQHSHRMPSSRTQTFAHSSAHAAGAGDVGGMARHEDGDEMARARARARERSRARGRAARSPMGGGVAVAPPVTTRSDANGGESAAAVAAAAAAAAAAWVCERCTFRNEARMVCEIRNSPKGKAEGKGGSAGASRELPSMEPPESLEPGEEKGSWEWEGGGDTKGEWVWRRPERWAEDDRSPMAQSAWEEKEDEVNTGGGTAEKKSGDTASGDGYILWQQLPDEAGREEHFKCDSTNESVDSLPSAVEWARETDQNSGEVYFIHLQSGDILWELPCGSHCVAFRT
jgi:hypothetical protein